ncbi:MAG: hypothetical protein AB7S59_15705 [Parvibaculaceae bacterium]
MSTNRDVVSSSQPANDRLAKHSPVAMTVVATVILSVLSILGTYILGGFTGLTGNGAGALIFGVFASFALGVGLMVAIFHSSRGYDDQAHYAAMDQFEAVRHAQGTQPNSPSHE